MFRTDRPWFIVSFDLHTSDRPEEIRSCLDWLANRGLSATFFIPTGMLEIPSLAEALSPLRLGAHELGSHSHRHDQTEVHALRGEGGDLTFLAESRETFKTFFGVMFRLFRSPFWCGLGQAARKELSKLGYRVDSSATPQRASLLSNYPYENPWLLSPRRPHLLKGTLPGAPILEVPTSTFLVPVGTAALGILNERGFRYFLEPFLLEADLAPRMGLVVQLHPGDLMASGAGPAPRRLRARDLWPRRRGGLGLRHWLQANGPERKYKNTVALIDAALDRGLAPRSFGEIYEQERVAGRAPGPRFTQDTIGEP
ncbi:MAG: polysaccharide deacetylase family protein [Deltaproteobacteria bacterium]|nr:polysaccharide deacetylase family protein [Deltaproteobacteria bacterium]